MRLGSPFLALLVALGGCITREMIEDAQDRDDDGYLAWQAGGDDCNDAESTANPGEEELCGDGLDNDCDGVVDDDGVNAATWYPDLDGDGFAIDAPVTACTAPPNHRPSLDAGIDCDDANAGARPGGVETWYDGIDGNCDGADDFDRDGDGDRAPLGGGNDCDDDDATVHPGAAEVCGNHRDDDCDGTHNDCAWSGDPAIDDLRVANVVWAFAEPSGVQVSLGDTNADGADDLVVAALDSQEIFVFEGPVVGTVMTNLHADTHLVVDEPPSILGPQPSARGDLDGDGSADILLFNAEENAWPVVRVFAAPLRSEMTVDDVTKVLYGPDPATTPSSSFGRSGGPLGDVDSDGIAEWWASQSGTSPSVCYVMEGMGAGTNVPAIARAALSHCSGNLRGVPDLDGDGIGDIAAPGVDRIQFASGVASGPIDLDVVPTVNAWTGGGQVNPVGSTESLDANSSADLLVMVASADFKSIAAEVVFDASADLDATSPRLRIDPKDADDAYVPLPPVDADGDGYLDLLLVHFARDLSAGTGTVAVDFFSGPLTPGVATRADATARLDPDLPMTLFMTWDTGDIDGDGYGDVVIGGLGQARVIYGQGR